MEQHQGIDINDVNELMTLEDTISKAVSFTNSKIEEESNLEILLMEKLKDYNIKSSLSPANKYLQMMIESKDSEVEKLFFDWKRATRDLKTAKNTQQQIENRRDSIKKKLTVLPK